MFLSKSYNAVFTVDRPILPGTETWFEDWYGYGEKRTITRLLAVTIMNKHIAQGHLAQPGPYLLHVHRKGLKMHSHLMRVGAPGASIHVIHEYVRDNPDYGAR